MSLTVAPALVAISGDNEQDICPEDISIDELDVVFNVINATDVVVVELDAPPPPPITDMYDLTQLNAALTGEAPTSIVDNPQMHHSADGMASDWDVNAMKARAGLVWLGQTKDWEKRDECIVHA